MVSSQKGLRKDEHTTGGAGAAESRGGAEEGLSEAKPKLKPSRRQLANGTEG